MGNDGRIPNDVIEKPPVVEESDDTAEVSMAGDFTAAVPHLGEPDVCSRVDVLSDAGDVPGVRPELREIISRCGKPDILTGSSVFREPSEILGRRVFADFDEECVDTNPDKPENDMAYRRVLAAVFSPFLTKEDQEALTGINGRPGHEEV